MRSFLITCIRLLWIPQQNPSKRVGLYVPLWLSTSLTFTKFQVDIAILDLPKAFDTVQLTTCLGTLQFYGMHSSLLDWTVAFLKTWTQFVVADGNHSKRARTLSGVPHSTVLGPLSFLLYNNVLVNVVTSSVCLFADDCRLYHPIHCAALQTDLTVLQSCGGYMGYECQCWEVSYNART